VKETTLPVSGDLFLLTRDASVQFTTPIQIRVSKAWRGQSCDGWVWLEGYSLSFTNGMALEKRQVYVNLAGLVRLYRPTKMDMPRPRRQVRQEVIVHG
jgi:hypothetical protein